MIKMLGYIPLRRTEITKIRTKAFRRGVWFRVLSREERAYINITIEVVDVVKSKILAKVLTTILGKVLDSFESDLTRVLKERGFSLAQKISQTAEGWGNRTACDWKWDPGFVLYLTVMHMNSRF